MKRIPLSGGRAFALVDDGDYEALTRWRWSLHASGYVVRNARGHTTYLHRQILGLERGDPRQVDHSNTNPLDNRRANLRVCSHATNQQNRAARRCGTSRFRGVYWQKSRQRWMAYARLGRRMKYLGYFESELDAALAAETYRQMHMPFAAPDAELLAALAQPEPLRVAA